MSLDKHLNLLYSGTTPLNLGDRYYSQDLIRDLLYSWDNTGQTARRILGTFPALLMGGVVTVGAGAHCLDITEAWGVCNYSVEHPDTFAALPPSKTSSDIARLVHAALQNELDTSALDTPATADGATPNYVKLRYAEANGNTRTRARAAGTYSYEVTPSYTYYCDAVAPTDYDIHLATVTITAGGVVTVTSQSVSYNIKDAQDDLDTAEAAIDVLEKKHGITNSAVATNTYTITDTDNINDIFCDPSLRAFDVDLPTLADNIGRIIRVKVITAGGAVTLDGEGGETIDGATTFVMQSSGDYCTVIGQATGWRILSAYAKHETGSINTADWTNRLLGNSQCIYDGLSGTFVVGELVTEYTDAGYTTPSGVTGIIMSDSGTVLVMKNVTGIGCWTNDYYIKGSTSLATARPNGSTKNADTNVTHNFGVSAKNLTKTLFIWDATTSASEADLIEVKDVTGNAGYGFEMLGVSTSAYTVKTNTSGVACIEAGGGVLDAEDWCYNVITEFKI